MKLNKIGTAVREFYKKWRISPLGTFVRGQVNAALAGVVVFLIFQGVSWVLSAVYGPSGTTQRAPAAFLYLSIEWIKVLAAVSGFAIFSISETVGLIGAIRSRHRARQPGSDGADSPTSSRTSEGS